MKMRLLIAVLLVAAFVACRNAGQSTSTETDLATFLENADSTILRLSNEANQAGWTQATYITPDTEAMSARASEAYMNAVTNFARRAATFNAGDSDAGAAAAAHGAQELADDGLADGSEGVSGAGEAGDVDGRVLRARQVLPGG